MRVECVYMDKITPLKRLLFEQQMTVTRLQRMTGITYNTLTAIVNGRPPRIEHAILIARVTNTTVEQLWSWTVDEK